MVERIPTMRFSSLLAWVLYVAACCATGGCQGEPVPFKREPSPDVVEDTEADDEEARSDETPAWHLVSDPANRLVLQRTEPGKESATYALSLRQLPAACSLASSHVQQDASLLFVYATYACDAASSHPAQEAWAVRLEVVQSEQAPRLIERFEVWPGTQTFTLGLRAQDVDQDGHLDLLLDVTWQADSTLTLTWLDRSGGLGLQPGEPEATLAALAERARAALAQDPASAIALADQTHSLHRSLCKEAGHPQLAVGGSPGLACGRSRAAGQAAAIRTLALAKQGNVDAALAAAERMESPAWSTSEAERLQAQQALARLGDTGHTRIEGPRMTLPRRPDVHLPLVVFTDGDQLRVRETRPRLVNLSSLHDSPVAPLPGDDLLLRDPSEKLAVVDILRTCDGYRLRIVPAAQVVSGVVATGRSSALPLIEALAPPSALGCQTNPQASRSEPAGYSVLGWTAEGIAVARGDSVRMLAVDAQGQAEREPEIWPPTRPLPLGLAPGRVSSQGTAYALRAPTGILVRTLGPQPRTRLVPAPATQNVHANVQDVALAPDGRSVALIVDGRVIVLRGMAPDA